MLALSRRVGESILIGDSIIVKVIKMSQGQVALGIDAPPDVNIARTELLYRDQKEDQDERERHFSRYDMRR